MRRPNIIFFTWHDAGRWFGCYDHPTVQTPAVDRLASEGVLFENCYSACAICSPSRASLMTGRHPCNHGVMGLANGPLDNRIYPHVPHLAALLRGEGYRTALFGVQHEAAHQHVAEILQVEEQFATDPWPQAEATAAPLRHWLREQAGKDGPFYAQIGTLEAHLNRVYSAAPPRPDESYPPAHDAEKGLGIPDYLSGSEADRATVGALQGLLRRGDGLMETLLQTLDETGLASETLVIMAVDHGVGLARSKGSGYSAGSQVAWILRWPGVLPAGHRVPTLTTHVDMMPTLWELLGRAPRADWDGQSLAPHARGEAAPAVNATVYGHMVEVTRTATDGRFRLIRNFRPPKLYERLGDCAALHRGFDAPANPPDDLSAPSAGRPLLELYETQSDPAEQHDLASDPTFAAITSELDARLWNFLLDNDDFIVHDPIRSPWQAATRRALEEHCQKTGRPCPRAVGPAVSAIDEAVSQGRIPDFSSQ